MSKASLDKIYEPSTIEARLYESWEKDGCFAAGRVPNGAPYTIVIPPPNVTGSLHMGHALNNTLQDILCRFERMRGRDVLWQPGTDHAGIATQMVVERQLAETSNISRHDMGREKFIERVWQWKQESGSTITEQLRRLGTSCDWSRERFTMDEGLSEAVVKVFVALYEQGLIFKDKRLVNWDPGLLTAISDLEVESREVNGHLWHFNYPLEDGSGHITVATTRPETMLGDSGVAVHPEDARFTDLVGKNVILPIVGRKIPIVADDYADPEQGSGAVKITPAHDFNDFEVGKRHRLAQINMLDQCGCIDLTDATFDDMINRESWHGLSREEGRKRVVTEMENLGLLVATEDNRHMVPFGDRSGKIIEPWLTDQWYVNAAELAKPALDAVKNGATKFVPQNWAKTYFDWLENIQPWCISRQLWWGHQIPAWYGSDGAIFVAESEAQAQAKADAHYGSPGKISRDEDVLDTWFSSALWPFSTLGWPQDTPALKRHYKTDVLVTGFDIIFFWVARMMMLGLHFMKEVPFHTVYIHALVRDEKGAKMSKSKGNVVDPLALMDKYGADALRFTLSAMAAMGRDIKLSEARIEGYRNFGTKLWNAARFCQMNSCFEAAAFDPAKAKLPLTQWLVGEVVRTQNAVTQALEAYRFNDAADGVYRFIWSNFCDWYIELAKPILQGDDGAEKAEVQAAAKWGLEHALHLLHPFMPFVTEELWTKTGQRKTHLMLDAWPMFDAGLVNDNEEVRLEINHLISIIKQIRQTKDFLELPDKIRVKFVPELGNQEFSAYSQRWLEDLAYVQLVDDDEVIEHELNLVFRGFLTLDVGSRIDLMDKKIEEMKKEVAFFEKKLANPNFRKKAPKEVVEENEQKLEDSKENLEKWQNIRA